MKNWMTRRVFEFIMLVILGIIYILFRILIVSVYLTLRGTYNKFFNRYYVIIIKKKMLFCKYLKISSGMRNLTCLSETIGIVLNL